MNNRAKTALAYEQITSLSSAVGFTSIPSGSEAVFVQPETQNVRMRSDGTNPTASVGMLLVANTIYEFSATNFATMKFIEATASAKLNIEFYGTKV